MTAPSRRLTSQPLATPPTPTATRPQAARRACSGVLDYEEVVGLYTRGYAYDPATMQTTGWTDDNGTDFRTVSFLYSGTQVTERQAIDGPTTETQSWSDWDAYGTPRHTTSAVGFVPQAEELRTTDDLGRIVSTNHSIDGTPLGTVTYGYTDNGSVASVSTTWAGGYELFRSGTGLVNEVHDLSTGALLAQIDGRDALGRPTHAFTVDGQIARAYDQMGRDTWFSTQSGALLDQRAYEYDDLGRASFVHHEDAEGIWLQEFVYENPGRLTHDIRSTGTGTTVYAWDAAGNRTSITKDGGATTISTYDSADRLLTVGATTLGYDPFGGIIDDGAGFGIPRGADGAEVGVDALSGSPATRLYTFWRNAGGEPVATEDVDGLHRQVWGNPGTDLPLAGEGPEGNWLWLAVDGIVLGQLRDGVALGAASDPSGSIAYFDGELAGVPGAFGEGAGLADVRHAWTGMETLPGTPYQLAQHRLYDTANGRFTVNDPIGLAGGDNRYAYAGGDPVQFVDPSGLFAALARRTFEMEGSGTEDHLMDNIGEAPINASAFAYAYLGLGTQRPSTTGPCDLGGNVIEEPEEPEEEGDETGTEPTSAPGGDDPDKTPDEDTEEEIAEWLAPYAPETWSFTTDPADDLQKTVSPSEGLTTGTPDAPDGRSGGGSGLAANNTAPGVPGIGAFSHDRGGAQAVIPLVPVVIGGAAVVEKVIVVATGTALAIATYDTYQKITQAIDRSVPYQRPMNNYTVVPIGSCDTAHDDPPVTLPWTDAGPGFMPELPSHTASNEPPVELPTQFTMPIMELGPQDSMMASKIPDDVGKAISEIRSGASRPNVRNPKPWSAIIIPSPNATGNPTYTEYTVNPRPPGGTLDGKRVIAGSDGSVYWTDDHFVTFNEVP